MTEDILQIEKFVSLICWTTPKVKIIQTPSFWIDEIRYYHFIPCKKEGFVVFTKSTDTLGCIPLQGYVLLRPTALSLHWPADRLVEFRKITKIAGQVWRAKTHRRWKTIAKQRNESKELPWWA